MNITAFMGGNIHSVSLFNDDRGENGRGTKTVCTHRRFLPKNSY